MVFHSNLNKKTYFSLNLTTSQVLICMFWLRGDCGTFLTKLLSYAALIITRFSEKHSIGSKPIQKDWILTKKLKKDEKNLISLALEVFRKFDIGSDSIRAKLFA